MRGLERRDDPLSLGEQVERRERILVRRRQILRAAGVPEKRVLWADAGIVEPGRDRVGVRDLAVLVREERRAGTVEDSGTAGAEARGAGCLDAHEAYGYDRFAADARAAGATSLIVADLPLEAAPDLARVQLVAPTSPAERIRLAAERTDGWLYLVSVTGTTGTRESLSSQLADLVERARGVTAVPLLAGFGIASADQAAAAAALADGVVVGSRAIEVAAEGGAEGLHEYVASLRSALDGAEDRGAAGNRTAAISTVE